LRGRRKGRKVKIGYGKIRIEEKWWWWDEDEEVLKTEREIRKERGKKENREKKGKGGKEGRNRGCGKEKKERMENRILERSGDRK